MPGGASSYNRHYNNQNLPNELRNSEDEKITRSHNDKLWENAERQGGISKKTRESMINELGWTDEEINNELSKAKKRNDKN